MKSKMRWTVLLSIGVGVCLALGNAGGQQNGKAGPPGREPAAERALRLSPRVIRTVYGTGTAEQLANSFDAGDSYATPRGRRKLHRLAGTVAVRLGEQADGAAVLADATGPEAPLAGYTVEEDCGKGLVVLQAPAAERRRQLQDRAALARTLAAARQVAGIERVLPVFINPENGQRAVVTGDIVLRLRAGVDPEAYFGAGYKNARRVRGTTDQFVLRLQRPTETDLFAELDRHAAHGSVEWVEPEVFLIKAPVTPDDTHFGSQWHLHNTGQGGGTSDADVDAPEVWDTTTGSDTIYIAVIDDGVQVSHPDLQGNFPSNALETPDNETDDEGNGWVDDVNGWDFIDDDNDPSPAASGDNHGTACAGVAAAVGNNGLGVAGAAYGCRLMPLRTATNVDVTEALYYAGGRHANGTDRWRGADVISMSFTFAYPLYDVSTAIEWVHVNGREGFGCPMFAATGNDASGYGTWGTLSQEMWPGTWSWVLSYKKNPSGDAGKDTVWMNEFVNSDGSVHRFDSTTPPPGWYLNPFAGEDGWFIEDDPAHAYGTSRYQVRPTAIADGDEAFIMAPAFTAGSSTIPGIQFKLWRSSQRQDKVWVYLWDWGESVLHPVGYIDGAVDSYSPAVGYPASHWDTIAVGASTNFDYRSDYSQYGTGLDFVAPSSGGTLGIYTTDRTGSAGYNVSGDYFSSFGGTSSATPLAAGVGALILSKNRARTAGQVQLAMRNSCDKIGAVTYTSGWNQYYGYGRVNAEGALSEAHTPTIATICSFSAAAGNGGAIVEWQTASEVGTAGFNLYRLDAETGNYVKLNDRLLPALIGHPAGGVYRFLDESAAGAGEYVYRLEEIESRGRRCTYGPFRVEVGALSADVGGLDSVPSYSSRRRRPRRAARATGSGSQVQAVALTQSPGAKPTSAKIAVTERDAYLVTGAELAAAMGMSEGDVEKLIAQGRLSLRNRGEDVAWLAASSGGGIWFYGEPIESIYTDENVYVVSVGHGRQMEVDWGSGPDSAEEGMCFSDTRHCEENRFALTALVRDPEGDYWFWDHFWSPETKDFGFELPCVAETDDEAALTVHFQGATATSHRVRLLLNGTELGECAWSGAAPESARFEFDQSVLLEGANVLRCEALLDDPESYSRPLLNGFDVTYERLYRAVEDRLFCPGGEVGVVTVDGFAVGDSEPSVLVFDVTEPRSPRLIKGVTVEETAYGYRASFWSGSSEARYFVVSEGALASAERIWPDLPSDLKSPSRKAEYLIITTSQLAGAARDLADWREEHGLRAMVVDVEDVYDEFNDGIASPRAVRRFLTHAHDKWSHRPRYVLLAGSGTYDYKDYDGCGGNLVPPMLVSTDYGLFSSDGRLADTDGDGVCEMAIGRIPVETPQALSAVIAKIKGYETSEMALPQEIVLAADDPDEGGDFPSDSDDLATLVPPVGFTTTKVYLSESDLDEAREQLLDAVRGEAALVNFLGHAGLDRLAQEGLLTSADVPSLGGISRPPVLTAMTCIVGRFELPGYHTLGELLVLEPTGGAIAAWAPSGLPMNAESKSLAEGFLQSALVEAEETLGDAVLAAQGLYAAAGGRAEVLYVYNLLGDPALPWPGSGGH